MFSHSSLLLLGQPPLLPARLADADPHRRHHFSRGRASPFSSRALHGRRCHTSYSSSTQASCSSGRPRRTPPTPLPLRWLHRRRPSPSSPLHHRWSVADAACRPPSSTSARPWPWPWKPRQRPPFLSMYWRRKHRGGGGLMDGLGSVGGGPGRVHMRFSRM